MFLMPGARARPRESTLDIFGHIGGNVIRKGVIGEFISSTVLVGSAVTLTTGVAKDITTIPLTAGDWDVWGNICIVPGGTITAFLGWISTTANTVPTSPNSGAIVTLQGSYTAEHRLPVGMMRLNLPTTTTVSLSIDANFTVSATAYGFVGARRAA